MPSCNPISSLFSLFAKWERSKKENYFSKQILSGQYCHVTIIAAVTQIKKKVQKYKKKKIKKDFKLKHWNLFTLCWLHKLTAVFNSFIFVSKSWNQPISFFIIFLVVSKPTLGGDSAWLIESLLMRLRLKSRPRALAGFKLAII